VLLVGARCCDVVATYGPTRILTVSAAGPDGSERGRRRIAVRRSRRSRPPQRTLNAGATLLIAAISVVAVRRSLMRVRGLSMRPTLREGDMVLTVPLPPVSGERPLHGSAWEIRRRLIRPGTLVVLSEPGLREHLIIKRITGITPDGVEVVGDDPGWSIDSRTFGTVPHRDVRRLVLGKVPAPDRR
jgi:signal peptidase I